MDTAPSVETAEGRAKTRETWPGGGAETKAIEAGFFPAALDALDALDARDSDIDELKEWVDSLCELTRLLEGRELTPSKPSL